MPSSLSLFLLDIPRATPEWAEIVGHLAWPCFLLILVFRFRVPLDLGLGNIASRLGTDGVRLGPLELRPGERIIPMDLDQDEGEAGDFDRSDVRTTEELLEFAGESDAQAARLLEWLAANNLAGLDCLSFLSDPLYASQRRAAAEELIHGKAA